MSNRRAQVTTADAVSTEGGPQEEEHSEQGLDAPSRAGHAETKIKRKDCEKELERVHADLCALPTASGKA